MHRVAKIHDPKSDTAWQRYLRSEKEWVFRAALKLLGLWRMLRRARVERRSKRGRLTTGQGPEMGCRKMLAASTCARNPAADSLQEQQTLIFDTTYDCGCRWVAIARSGLIAALKMGDG